MVSAPEAMKHVSHIYECRTNVWGSLQNTKGRKALEAVGFHGSYAANWERDAKCPGVDNRSSVNVTCWSVPDDSELVGWYRKNFDRFNSRQGMTLSNAESAYWSKFLNELMTIDGDFDSETVASLREEFTGKYLTNNPDRVLPITRDGVPVYSNNPPAPTSNPNTSANGPHADIPIEQKSYPHSYTCTCPDYSDVELSTKAGADSWRLWKTERPAKLANGWRVCKHVLRVLQLKGEIREADIPDDAPIPDPSTLPKAPEVNLSDSLPGVPRTGGNPFSW
jgi:hypothetical protein